MSSTDTRIRAGHRWFRSCEGQPTQLTIQLARKIPLDPERHAEWMKVAVGLYTDNARRYRHGLRRIDPDGKPDE